MTSPKMFISFILILSIHLMDCQFRIVEINSGLIKGQQLLTVNQKKPYYSFQGVPFAEPPLGALRFEPPQPKKKWVGILNATAYRNDCVQTRNSTVVGNEDCLHVNIYTPIDPSKRTPDVSLPVAVFLYEGGFQNGGSNPQMYGPDYFMNEEVIVVTFNYRLGVLGFLSTGDLVMPGNAGLKDQIMALKWVNGNIRSFGGDPGNVTIFGESAGAASIPYLMMSPLSSGLFHRGIMESGSSLCSWAFTKRGPEASRLLGGILNINTTSSHVLVEQLKNLPYQTLQTNSNAIPNRLFEMYGEYENDIRTVFLPVAEPPHPGAAFTGKSHQRFVEGRFHPMPMIIGFNSFEYLNYPYGVTFQTAIPNDLNIGPEEMKVVDSLVESQYFPKNSNRYLQGLKLYGENFYVRPTVETARLLSILAPTYLYLFSYVPNNESLGVPHGGERRYLWYNPNNLPPLEEEFRLLKLWTNFFKTGIPTSANLTWDCVDTFKDDLTYLEIGETLQMRKNPEGYSLKFWNGIYQKYGRPPFDTY